MIHEEEVLGRSYDHGLMRRLMGFLRPYRGQMLFAGIVVVTDSLVGLVAPLGPILFVWVVVSMVS